MNTTRLYAAAIAFLLVAPMSLVSHAQKASAQATFAKAFDAYQAFDCEQALSLFAKGVAQSPDPKAYYFMGNCERWRLNRAGADKAYDNGLKLAPKGSPVRADLESAKASLAVAFDPALQTKLFYEAAKKAGIDLPDGMQAAIDPRFVPVHLDWEWELASSMTSSQAQEACPYFSKSGPSISHITNGITTNSSEFRCDTPEKESVTKSVVGYGLAIFITDDKWDRERSAQNGKTQYRDAKGWQYVRTISSTNSQLMPPRPGWIDYQETTDTTINDHDKAGEKSVVVTRCQYKPSINAKIRRLSDGPQLEALCASKTSTGSTYQSTYSLDLVSGQMLEQTSNIAGVEITQEINGHIGRIGDTLTRVQTSKSAHNTTVTTWRLTRKR